MKLKIIFCLAAVLVLASAFSQNRTFRDEAPANAFSAGSANRQTALRYLRLAKGYALNGDWEKCGNAAKSGNDYDKTVADLWYLAALAEYNRGASRKTVLALLGASLDGKEWVDYNKSSARIFYADLLCATGKPSLALQVLDEKPFIYSSDAEFVRIKACYSMGDAENVERARERVDVNRRIYPADSRFAHIFFSYEYRIMYSKNYSAGMFDCMPPSGKARRIADYFITRVPEYDSRDVDLELYAAVFAEGEQKTRLLKAFDARGFKSPMYAAAALEDGIFSDAEAMKYFLDFMDGRESGDVSFFELERFASSLTDESVKKDFAVYLNAYTGTLYSDTNNNLENNLAVVYSRGRPQKIIYDSENDGVEDWNCDLDFGVPRSARFEEKKITVYYGTYPSPVRILFEEVPGEDGYTVFNLADEVASAEIFRIKKDAFIASVTDFFVIEEGSLWSGTNLFDRDRLIASISSMEKPSQEKSGAFIRFLMLNGKAYAADYLCGGKVYAHAQFTNPLVRNTDTDGDGIFETTEIYAALEEGIVISREDFDAASRNIWGSPAPDSDRYLKMIQIDRNGDTRPDFTEEYFTLGGRISTWDLDYDGEWDTRHIIKSAAGNEGRFEVTEIFVLNTRGEKSLVSINTVNSEPAEIVIDGKSLAVTKGSSRTFYWVGGAGSESLEQNIIGQMKTCRTAAVEQFEEDGCYLQAVCVDGNIFARILKKTPLEENDETVRE